jgi:hypothetical protein
VIAGDTQVAGSNINTAALQGSGAGGTSQAGVSGFGGSSGGAGMLGTGNGAGNGVTGVSPTGNGLAGSSTNTGNGILGAAGPNGGVGVLATGSANGAPLWLTPLNSAPLNPYEGQFYYDSSVHKLYLYNGTAWKQVTSA